jgi:mannose-6-phosphate isomerase-like protein (cupin superfamily)
MIRKKGSYAVEIKEKMRGGDGSVRIEKFWEPEKELKAKNRLFAKLVLEPGSGIGFHNHDKEEEVFVILKGKAEVDDNGVKTALGEGDTILTGNGAGHSIKCVGDTTLEVLAVISCYNS